MRRNCCSMACNSANRTNVELKWMRMHWDMRRPLRANRTNVELKSEEDIEEMQQILSANRTNVELKYERNNHYRAVRQRC